ncbi:MAG TPA: hypothetical protein VL986_07865 [Terracidiphilus sp.]|nr:hypothetical protein [Terracidiphilus sp.]
MLKRLVGEKRLLECDVIEPTDEYFPDPYDGSEVALRAIFSRLCAYMQVDAGKVDLEVIPNGSEIRELLPTYNFRSNDPAGLHFGENEGEKPLIGVRKSLLKDPLTVVATIAHELGHVILLDGGLLSRDKEDMEPMTDLITVYLGFGIFNANASRRFHKYRNDRVEGWSMSRLGYLPEVVFAYALAIFAKERGESDPPWISYLSTNLKTYFKQSATWLARNANQPS